MTLVGFFHLHYEHILRYSAVYIIIHTNIAFPFQRCTISSAYNRKRSKLFGESILVFLPWLRDIGHIKTLCVQAFVSFTFFSLVVAKEKTSKDEKPLMCYQQQQNDWSPYPKQICRYTKEKLPLVPNANHFWTNKQYNYKRNINNDSTSSSERNQLQKAFGVTHHRNSIHHLDFLKINPLVVASTKYSLQLRLNLSIHLSSPKLHSVWSHSV